MILKLKKVVDLRQEVLILNLLQGSKISAGLWYNIIALFAYWCGHHLNGLKIVYCFLNYIVIFNQNLEWFRDWLFDNSLFTANSLCSKITSFKVPMSLKQSQSLKLTNELFERNNKAFWCVTSTSFSSKFYNRKHFYLTSEKMERLEI